MQIPSALSSCSIPPTTVIPPAAVIKNTLPTQAETVLRHTDTVGPLTPLTPLALPQLSFLPSAAERIEQAVQDLWNSHNNSQAQTGILRQFERDLNQQAAEPHIYLYSEQELLQHDQLLQQRIEKIQRQLDDGTPDCGGGMQQELTACLQAQQGLQQALQLRYLGS